MTDTEAFHLFLATKKPDTAKTYKYTLKQYVRFLDGRHLNALTITKMEFLDFVLWNKNRLKESTLACRAAILRSFYTWANAVELTNHNPTPVLKVLSLRGSGSNFNPKPVAPEDMQEILKSLKYGTYRECRFSCIVLLGLFEGMRISEACRLKWECVNFKANHIAWVGKRGRARLLDMNLRVSTALKELRHLQAVKWGLFPPTYCFAGWGDYPVSDRTIQEMFKRRLVEWKLDPSYTFHKLRHTFGTMLAANGANIYEIRDLMGHASIVTSQHYVKADAGRTRKTYHRIMDRMAGGKSNPPSQDFLRGKR